MTGGLHLRITIDVYHCNLARPSPWFTAGFEADHFPPLMRVKPKKAGMFDGMVFK